MDAIMAVKKGVPGAALPELRERKVPLRPQKSSPTHTVLLVSEYYYLSYTAFY
jgi:hypothetical protein